MLSSDVARLHCWVFLAGMGYIAGLDICLLTCHCSTQLCSYFCQSRGEGGAAITLISTMQAFLSLYIACRQAALLKQYVYKSLAIYSTLEIAKAHLDADAMHGFLIWGGYVHYDSNVTCYGEMSGDAEADGLSIVVD